MAWQKYTPENLNELASELEARAKSLRDAAATLKKCADDGGEAYVELNQSLSKNSPLTKGLNAVMAFAAEVTAKAGVAQVRRVSGKD